MNFAADFLAYVGLTVMTLLPIINPVGTAVLLLLLGIGASACSSSSMASANCSGVERWPA